MRGLIGRLKCWYHGKHLRGRFVGLETNGTVGEGKSRRVYACPRCGRQTFYRAPV